MDSKGKILALAAALVLLALTAAVVMMFSLKENPPVSSVSSFEECVAAGNPVMESYPRKCSYGGRTFTEAVSGGGGGPIGGQRDGHGCLGPAGYSWSQDVGACTRVWELDETERAAARAAVAPLGFQVTVLEVNSSDCAGCFVVLLQRNDRQERIEVKVTGIGAAGNATGSGGSAGGNASAADVVGANNLFALDLYGQLKGAEGNVFFSPFSVSTALLMTYEGARGVTADEMKAALHLPDGDDSRRAAVRRMLERINEDSRLYELNTANALWPHKDYPFLPAYVSVLKEDYLSEATPLDYSSKTEESRQAINGWVEDKTNDKIKNLIPPGVLNPMTRMVLTNTIYFKGRWVTMFNETNTREEDFHVSADKTVKAPMMRLVGNDRFNYFEDDKVQVLELPYEGDRLSMLLILPKDARGISSLEASLSADKLGGWRSGLRKREVKVYVPKFRMETKYFLPSALKKLGMKAVFNPGEADLSGMDGTRNLYVSDVIHQAFVEVNEEGTEAAAATAVVVGLTAMREDTVFRADHPFIFIIQDKDSGNILFMGRVSDPAS